MRSVRSRKAGLGGSCELRIELTPRVFSWARRRCMAEHALDGDVRRRGAIVHYGSLHTDRGGRIGDCWCADIRAVLIDVHRISNDNTDVAVDTRALVEAFAWLPTGVRLYGEHVV